MHRSDASVEILELLDRGENALPDEIRDLLLKNEIAPIEAIYVLLSSDGPGRIKLAWAIAKRESEIIEAKRQLAEARYALSRIKQSPSSLKVLDGDDYGSSFDDEF